MKTSLMLLVILVMAQTGCGSTKYSPIHADAPMPPDGSPPLCSELMFSRESPTLHKGERCVSLVRADQKLTRTPLSINEGDTYKITVPPNQVWYDKSRRNVPPYGEKGSWLMERFNSWKQRKESLWFALIAAEVSADKNSVQQYESFDVSTESELKFKQSGMLVLYPNDAIVPFFGSMYSNNSGQVWVQIEHK